MFEIFEYSLEYIDLPHMAYVRELHVTHFGY